MSSKGDSKHWGWKTLIGIVWALFGGAGFAIVLALVNAFITFGEMRNEVRHQGDRMTSFNEKLDAFDKKLSDFGVSQSLMKGNIEMIVRFIMKGEKGEDSASLGEDGSAENVPAGMSM